MRWRPRTRVSITMASRSSSIRRAWSTLTVQNSILSVRGLTKASSSTALACVANAAAARASTSEDAVGIPCHYALFDLQPAFDLDLDMLSSRYRELARKVHPDRS